MVMEETIVGNVKILHDLLNLLFSELISDY